MGTKEAFGTFEYDVYVAPVVCDTLCETKKKAAAALAETKRLADIAAKKLADAAKSNPVAVGLGVTGGLLALCAVVYCCCKHRCKKDEMDASHSEGGKKAIKQSLLIHTEEA